MEFVKAAGQLRIPGEAEEGILIGFKRYSGVLLTLDNCLLTDERLSRSPSAEQGLPMDVEEQLRKQGCELIQAAGILLRLPQVAMATGQILFQRFFYCKSFIRHCVENVAMACVHLASKIEEEPRRVRDVINVFHRLKQDRECGVPAPLPLDGSYVNMKNQVIVAERRVLKELGFCVHVKHPHKIIVMYLQVLECEKNTQLVQTAWNYMNDSLRTDVFLRFSAEMVACACIYLAARSLQIPLPDSPPWFLLFGATEEDLKGICCRVLRLYLLPSVPLSALQERVTECRRVLEATRAKSALMGPLLLANGTPTLEPPSSFSPASKPSSPHTVTQVSRDSPQSQAALKDARRNLANGKIRLSHSDERKEVPHASPPRSPRRRRSRSVASPPRSLSPTRRKKQPGGYQRERERERERGRRREREREKERGRKDRVSSHRRVTDEGRVHTDQTSRLLQ